jgi:chemotaxis regulatin CheY-phosphate phosphatase CheZ
MPASHDHQPELSTLDDRGATFVAIPARTRDDIGQLAFYLEEARKNLLTVNTHLAGSARTMPGVLQSLKEIVTMTEQATLQVLDETESLLAEAQSLTELIREIQRAAGGHAASEITRPLTEVHALLERGSARVMTIMGALEFQDVTSQKIQRAFEVLEEVAQRLGKIHDVVSLGEEIARPAPDAASIEALVDEPSGQDLADEILLRFAQ